MEIVLTNKNIEEVLNNNQLVLVDFWAVWCGPCRALAPIVDEVASEMEGKVCVCKCDVGVEQDIAMKYGIMSIPTLIYFKNGEIAAKSVGLVSKNDIISKLNSLL